MSFSIINPVFFADKTKRLLVGLLFSCYLFTQGQSDSLRRQQRMDSIIKYHFIFNSTTDVSSVTSYQTFEGQGKGSTTTRSIDVDFRVGTEGWFQNIGRRGKNLKKVLQHDSEAMAELHKAYHVHLRKKRLFNTLEYISYPVALGSIAPLVFGIDDSRPGLIAIGAVGVVAGWVGIYTFWQLTEKHMDAWKVSVNRAINIYNKNLLKNIK
jgi:hypothetical protein